MVLVWAGARDGGAVVGLFPVMEEFDKKLGVGLGVKEVEIPPAVVVDDKLPVALVEKFGMKGGGNAEIGAVFDNAPRGFTFVIVPFKNQTP